MIIERVKNVAHRPYKTNCRNCGKEIVLFMNGGELDREECCGYTYGLESRGVDFIVSNNKAVGES